VMASQAIGAERWVAAKVADDYGGIQCR
jgi:hypothetical protein